MTQDNLIFSWDHSKVRKHRYVPCRACAPLVEGREMLEISRCPVWVPALPLGNLGELEKDNHTKHENSTEHSPGTVEPVSFINFDYILE